MSGRRGYPAAGERAGTHDGRVPAASGGYPRIPARLRWRECPTTGMGCIRVSTVLPACLPAHEAGTRMAYPLCGYPLACPRIQKRVPVPPGTGTRLSACQHQKSASCLMPEPLGGRVARFRLAVGAGARAL